jgi:hypothetical protein
LLPAEKEESGWRRWGADVLRGKSEGLDWLQIKARKSISGRYRVKGKGLEEGEELAVTGGDEFGWRSLQRWRSPTCNFLASRTN